MDNIYNNNDTNMKNCGINKIKFFIFRFIFKNYLEYEIFLISKFHSLEEYNNEFIKL